MKNNEMNQWLAEHPTCEEYLGLYILLVGRNRWACCCLVVKSCPTLHDPMDQSTPGPPIFHCLPEFGLIHLGNIDDTVQPSRLLSSPSPLAFTLSQHQGLFQGDLFIT